MSSHLATVHWTRGEQPFVDNRYSRRHALRFDGGAEWAGSSSPHVVRVPMSDPSAVDPEEAFVAALASCHMLWFLSLVAAEGWCVDDYRDDAVAEMGLNDRGREAVVRVTLRPVTRFAPGRAPDAAALARLHHEAHEACYLANSVACEIRCEPAFGT